ncbi:FAD-binding monooxygenase [Actinomycetospora sp. NBRC 106375]|uniref:FAD-dependent oxidoreductase n=1 Tax=Actinomycetospora sp. NBRC 106375 TaxID=3032207 RepID=UPI0024A26650|nr:FAD-dependent oxidoreductase [Actinomycetospora sp. NBRC 106375]GLZ46396.1 FAD-binding monooxygenase [Actinomycetospora sp. NBRC 106375]
MGAIVVCGGGMVGLSAALMLARDGHRVTVLESDAQEPPPTERAWASWSRRGVAQFRQPHGLFARVRAVLDAELPDLPGRMRDAGCVTVDPLAALPPTVTDREPRDDDEALTAVTGRRPVVEAVVAATAAGTHGLRIRRGVTVTGLLMGPRAGTGAPSRCPHVVGVRTAAGEEIRADLVVDATGRRGPGARWLYALGAPLTETRAVDRGFVYYTRFYTGPTLPPRIGPPLAPLGSVSLLTLPGDGDTWSVTVYGLAADRALRAVRDPAVFDQVVGACPWQAPWLAGERITGVLPMGGGIDRRTRLVRAGRPVVTGLVAIGDAWCATNPSAGRGISIGVTHAQALRHVVRDHLGDAAALAEAFDGVTERAVAPLVEVQTHADRVRVAEMQAEIAGEPAGPTDDPMTRLAAAAGEDADALRGLLEIVNCLALPDEVLARPRVRAAVDALGPVPPRRVPGPDRAELLALLAEAPGLAAVPAPRDARRAAMAS